MKGRRGLSRRCYWQNIAVSAVLALSCAYVFLEHYILLRSSDLEDNLYNPEIKSVSSSKIEGEVSDPSSIIEQTPKRGVRVFVSYAYAESEKNKSSRNLVFFLRHGVNNPTNIKWKVDYGLVVNGPCHAKECTNPKAFLQLHGGPPALRVIRRENVGYDFGAHTSMLEKLDLELAQYDYYIFLNSGVTGPFYPSYMPRDWHWTNAFVDRFETESKSRAPVGIVGTSIVCLPKIDLGGYGPKVEAFAYAMSAPALRDIRLHGTSFSQHESKLDAILSGEYNLTKTAFSQGYTIDCLLKAYEGIDWLDRNNWDCNDKVHPTRAGTYFKSTVSPMEVLFHKERFSVGEPINSDILKVYMDSIDFRPEAKAANT